MIDINIIVQSDEANEILSMKDKDFIVIEKADDKTFAVMVLSVKEEDFLALRLRYGAHKVWKR